ncbi:AAA family ATPase [Polyangium aurulentum]|nr:AAA family ATPase [Polyangium aurulentum]
MITAQGYSVGETVAETAGFTAYRARRDRDGQKVVLKVLRVQGARSADIARFKHQYDRIARIVSPRIVTVHGIEETPGALLIAQEDFTTRDLASVLRTRGKLPVREALEIGRAIAEALAAIHDAGLVHRDLRPHNVLIDENAHVKLTGFGVDAEITRAHESLYAPAILTDVLPYVSPEQTGRMNRGVDYRSDLYSLGVILYQALTGKRPFSATDPMELFHAHLASLPPPVDQVDHAIPSPVARVIEKLLEKNAEERYQSAKGLIADLDRCLTAVSADRPIEPFNPGRDDRTDLFRIHQKLYGRERDIDALVGSFERVLAGSREIVLVSGYSGIGKSSLVQEILKPLARQRGYYTSGKYDQFNRDTPYSAVIQAFDGLVRQILTESEARIAKWKAGLLEALGSNGQVICDVIPSLVHILGEQPPVPALGPVEAQNRLNLSFLRFVSVFAKQAHPLVLFLDDLQWIDLASLGLLRSLLADETFESFFFCGAYRDNEVSPGHPFVMIVEELRRAGMLVTDIVLAPLERRHLLQMLTDSLGRDDAGPLADAVLKKTGGNPFFVKRFVRSLHDNGVLAYAPSVGWRWDLAKIDALAYTDNVVDLMVRTIQRLPAQTQEALKLAAAIGNRFDLDVLATVAECSPEEAYGRLERAVEEGLLSASRAGYRFAHDKVQEAAYSMIPIGDRPGFHLRIGRLLSRKLDLSDSQNIFDIVGHLNSAGDLVATPAERLILARMNLDAAGRAEESAAFGAALRYLELGLARLPEDAWTSNYHLRLAYALKTGLMLSLSGRHDEALETLSDCLEHADGRLERTEVLRLKMNVYVLKNDLPAALAEGLSALRAFDIDLPPFPDEATLEAQIQTTMAIVAERSIEALPDLPPLADPEIRALQNVLQELFAPTYFLATNNYGISVAKILELTFRHGLSGSALYGCVIFGSLLCIRGDLEGGYRFGKAAVALAERWVDKKNEAMLRNMWGGFIQHWKEPLAACRETLLAGIHAGLETGQYIWAFYNTVNVATNSFMRGLPLADILAEVKSFQPLYKLDRFNAITWMASAVGQIAHNLTNEVEHPSRLVGPHVDIEAVIEDLRRIDSKSALFFADLYITFGCAFQGDFEQGARVAMRADPDITGIAAWHGTPSFHCYAGLALTQAATTAPPEERARMLARAEIFSAKLVRWAEFGPQTLGHRSALLLADLERVRGDARAAGDRYDDAIALAKQGRYIHDEALANELCGRHYLALGKTTIARAYLTEAHRLYDGWGASTAVRRLERAHPDLVPREREAPAQDAASLDIASILKASQAISGEIVHGRLLDALMRILLENAGARRGMLLLEREGALVVEAEHCVGEESVRVLDAQPLESRSDLPASVVTYAARTRETVLLDESVGEGPFGHDPYFSDSAPRSALAAPIVSKGRLAGVIYLENDLTSFTFTPDRVEILGLLSTQAAIAIENARLYADLEQKVAERTAELRRAHDDILALSHAEQEAQQALIERQKEVIHSLSTPIIEVWDGVIAVPLMGAVDDQRSEDIMGRLLDRISRASCRSVILDLTGVEVVDPHSAERIVRIVQAARLLGSRVLVTGIRPAVAQAMIHLGADLTGLTTRATLRDALRLCMRERA